MKKFIVPIILFAAIALMPQASGAADTYPLGDATIELKIARINFTDSVVKRANVDSGLYLGLEAYTAAAPNIYLGGEFGYSNLDGSSTVFAVRTENEITYVPLEFNAKFAIGNPNNLAFSMGGGVSLNYVKERATLPNSVIKTSSDWLLGLQLFAAIHYVQDQFFFGADLKLKLTEEFHSAGYDYNNFVYGIHGGLKF
ncbi:MAG: hypothetical protein OEV59_05490 [Deltaproteobacteria bacterium]|nr:hypothetical protein [Deltaproteobacteria bacterium]